MAKNRGQSRGLYKQKSFGGVGKRFGSRVGGRLGSRLGKKLGKRLGGRYGKKLAEKYLPMLLLQMLRFYFPALPFSAEKTGVRNRRS